MAEGGKQQQQTVKLAQRSKKLKYKKIMQARKNPYTTSEVYCGGLLSFLPF